MNQYVLNHEGDFGAAIEYFRKEIANIRTGRANPNMLEGIMVDAYGVKNIINAVANITVVDARSMTITPWDRNISKDIEKAIIEADLGVSVVNEGDKIRLNVPMMTEENRKELVKKLSERQEKARISVRQIREDVKSEIEVLEDAKEMSEDERFRFIKELDERVSSLNEEIKAIRDKKEADIMTI